MVRDNKGKGKAIMKDDDKSIDALKQTQEEEPKIVDVPKQTQEEEPTPLEHMPYPTTASSSKGIKISGAAHYALRSLGTIKEEIVVVKTPYNYLKVTNIVLGLRAQKKKLDVLV
ncbi:hypothetical protein Tco_1402146 [Tanacetum coccineum]